MQPLDNLVVARGVAVDHHYAPLELHFDVFIIGLLFGVFAARQRLWSTAVGLDGGANEEEHHVEDDDAWRLVAYARQAVVAMYAAFDEPFEPRARLRADAPGWDEVLPRAVASGSIHGIKLIEALERFADDDPLWLSVAAEWFDWT